jgi:hypothetical protein
MSQLRKLGWLFCAALDLVRQLDKFPFRTWDLASLTKGWIHYVTQKGYENKQ